MAYRLVALGQALPVRVTAWYRKSEATVSDVLAMVSRVLWAEIGIGRSLTAHKRQLKG